MRISAILLSLFLWFGMHTLYAVEGTVNINIASVEKLAKTLSGIGLKRAKQIVEYRERFGPFTSVEQLGNVNGIGEKTVEKNRDQLTIN